MFVATFAASEAVFARHERSAIGTMIAKAAWSGAGP